MTTAHPDETLELDTRVVAIRTYSATLTPGDGRTVDLRIVPYGERAQANDGLGGFPRGVVYTEEFLPGVFDHQIKAANRVLLDVEHEEGIAAVAGFGVELASRSDGFHGSFRFLETPAGETARALVREGVLTNASVECFFLKSIRDARGVVRRVKAQLNKVALCRHSAYAGAEVLGLRVPPEPELELETELLPVPFDAELASRIAALGITIPDRLLEPPATDPSAEADPSETTPSSGDDNDDHGGSEE